MKYITITSKHHDGFAMFDSKVTDYDIVDRTPYKKDVLKAAGRRVPASRASSSSSTTRSSTGITPTTSRAAGPAATPAGRTAATGTGTSTTWTRQLTRAAHRLRRDRRHLVRRLVGPARRGLAAASRPTTLIHELQPAALVGNNHHGSRFPGEDFQMFEKDLPGEQHRRLQRGRRRSATCRSRPARRSTTRGASTSPTARYKSTRELIHYLVQARPATTPTSCSTSGPMPNGKIQPEFVDAPAGDGRSGWRSTASRSTARAAARSRRGRGA